MRGYSFSSALIKFVLFQKLSQGKNCFTTIYFTDTKVTTFFSFNLPSYLAT